MHGLNYQTMPIFLEVEKPGINSNEKCDYEICCRPQSLWTAACSGQLFKKHCKSSTCQEYAFLNELVRYIHFNLPKCECSVQPFRTWKYALIG